MLKYCELGIPPFLTSSSDTLGDRLLKEEVTKSEKNPLGTRDKDVMGAESLCVMFVAEKRTDID